MTDMLHKCKSLLVVLWNVENNVIVSFTTANSSTVEQQIKIKNTCFVYCQ